MAEHWWDSNGGYAADIMSVLAATPERPVVHWRSGALTCGQLVNAVTATAGLLVAHEVGPGRTVAVLVAPNSPDMLITRYAAHLVGATVCYIRTANPSAGVVQLPLTDQLRILHETAPTVLVTDTQNIERANELVQRAVGTALIPAGSSPTNEVSTVATAQPWRPEKPAVIGYTSGSTGRPKGVVLSGRAWESSVRATMSAPSEAAEVTMLVTTPLSHTVGPMADAVLAIGGAVALREQFDARDFVESANRYRATRTFLATAHLYDLLDHLSMAGHADAGAAGLEHLRRLIYSGSPAAPARVTEAARVLGMILVQAYGTTECGRITSLIPPEHRDPRLAATVGRPFPEVEIAVHDLTTEAVLSAGGVGEVWIRSPHVMDGYLHDPEGTAAVLRAGWYRTGDIGYRDADGYLHLLDRVADVAKIEGIKVYPSVVERELLAVPEIAQAAVYKVVDADHVDHLHASVACRNAASVSIEALRAHLANTLSPVHVPEVIRLLDDVPLNAVGKPDKARLRAAATPYAGAPKS